MLKSVLLVVAGFVGFRALAPLRRRCLFCRERYWHWPWMGMHPVCERETAAFAKQMSERLRAQIAKIEAINADSEVELRRRIDVLRNGTARIEWAPKDVN